MKDPCLPHDHPINQEWGGPLSDGGYGWAGQRNEAQSKCWPSFEATLKANDAINRQVRKALPPPPTTVRVCCTDRDCAELSGYAWSHSQDLSDTTPLPTVCPRCVMPLERREY